MKWLTSEMGKAPLMLILQISSLEADSPSVVLMDIKIRPRYPMPSSCKET